MNPNDLTVRLWRFFAARAVGHGALVIWYVWPASTFLRVFPVFVIRAPASF